MSNYPDDIRCFDHDPRSPFFSGDDEPDTEGMTNEWLEANPELAEQVKRLELCAEVTVEADADEDGLCSHTSYKVNGCDVEGDEQAVAEQLARIDLDRDDAHELIEAIVPDANMARLRRRNARLAAKN